MAGAKINPLAQAWALIWAGRAYLFACAGLLLFAIVTPWCWQWSERSIRSSSFALQFCGLWIVVKGVADTRKQFGQRSLLSRYVLWVKADLYEAIKRMLRFMRIMKKLPAITGTAHATSGLGAMSATGYIGLAPAPTIEGRVAELEKLVTRLHATVVENQVATSERMNQFSVELEKDRSDRDTANEALGKKLEATATGGLDLSMFGVVLLAAGALYGAFPQEISDFMVGSITPRCWGSLASLAEGISALLRKA
jgi:hypothetical protein